MRSARVSGALVGVAGAILLAGCSRAADGGADAGTGGTATDATAPYTDGTYTAEGSYQTPESVETISVTLTLKDDVVTNVEVIGDPIEDDSAEHQAMFIGGIDEVVVGKKLDELDVDRVAGSSLTSGGFNQAVLRIKDQAAVGATE